MTDANWCQLMPNTNPHHGTKLPGKLVPIGAAPYRGAPISTSGAAQREDRQ